MRAILVELPVAGELVPLVESRPAALLPIANRPLIDLHLEALAAAGVKRVDLYLQTYPDRVREHVGAGERWGLTVRYHSVREPKRCLPPGVAWATGQEPVIALALELRWDAEALTQLVARCGAGLSIPTDPAAGRLPMFVWQPGGNTTAKEEPAVPGWARLDGARAYVEANKGCLARLRETAHLERAFPNGLYLGRAARLDDSARVTGPALVGAETRIGAAATIGADTVIGPGCVIDHGAELTGCVVLNDCYVGPSALLRNKIVDGGWVIDVRSGLAAYVDDRVLLGSCASRRPETGWWRRAAVRSLAALAGAAVCLPIGAWALWRGVSGRDVATRETRFVAGGRDLAGRVVPKTVRLWTLAADRPAWRRLPWLWAVALGELALIGLARPARQAEAVTDPDMRYAMLQHRAPVGAALHAGTDYLLQCEAGTGTRALGAALLDAMLRPLLQWRKAQ